VREQFITAFTNEEESKETILISSIV